MVFVASGRRISLRALASADAATRQVPVLASSEALDLGRGHVEIAAASGLLTAPASVVRDGRDGLAVRFDSARQVTQRRDAVRGDVELSLLVAVRHDYLEAVDGGAAPARGRAALRAVAGTGPRAVGRVLRGRTVNVSAGGLLAVMHANPEGFLRVGMRLPAEMTLPSGEQVSAVLEVIELRGWWVRTAFAEIEPRAREKLVRLVFTRERAALAQRREQRRVDVRTSATVARRAIGSRATGSSPARRDGRAGRGRPSS